MFLLLIPHGCSLAVMISKLGFFFFLLLLFIYFDLYHHTFEIFSHRQTLDFSGTTICWKFSLITRFFSLPALYLCCCVFFIAFCFQLIDSWIFVSSHICSLIHTCFLSSKGISLFQLKIFWFSCMVLGISLVILFWANLNRTLGFQYFQAAIGKDIIDVTLIARRCTRRTGMQNF